MTPFDNEPSRNFCRKIKAIRLMIFSTIYFAVIPESFHASRNTALTKLKFAARRMMHISFMALFLLTSTYNVNANGQNLSDVKISLELSQEPFSGAITKIESSSPFRFVYRDEEIRGIKNLSLKRKIRTVEETLTELLNTCIASSGRRTVTNDLDLI